MHAHQLAILIGALAAIPLWRRGVRPVQACLALLALTFLLRCLLDPANFSYYEIPFVLSLAAWELLAGRRVVLAPATTAALWLVIGRSQSAGLEYAGYLAIMLALSAVLLGPAIGHPGIVQRDDRHPRGAELPGGAAASG